MTDVLPAGVHTSLNEYNPLMSKDEYIVGPVAEYWVEGGGTFDEPVEIIIPHCVQPDKTGNIRVLCGTGELYRVRTDDMQLVCLHVI